MSELKPPYWGRWMTEKLIWRVGLFLCIIQSSVFNSKQMSQLHRGWAASLRLVHHVLATEQSFDSFVCAFYTVPLFKQWTIVNLIDLEIKHLLENVQCVKKRVVTLPALVLTQFGMWMNLQTQPWWKFASWMLDCDLTCWKVMRQQQHGLVNIYKLRLCILKFLTSLKLT